jgi:hypothetical protein
MSDRSYAASKAETPADGQIHTLSGGDVAIAGLGALGWWHLPSGGRVIGWRHLPSGDPLA